MEGSLYFQREMCMRQKGVWRLTQAVVYVSLFTALFHAIILMLHQCGERVTSLKHAILLPTFLVCDLWSGAIFEHRCDVGQAKLPEREARSQ